MIKSLNLALFSAYLGWYLLAGVWLVLGIGEGLVWAYDRRRVA